MNIDYESPHNSHQNYHNLFCSFLNDLYFEVYMISHGTPPTPPSVTFQDLEHVVLWSYILDLIQHAFTGDWTNI